MVTLTSCPFSTPEVVPVISIPALASLKLMMSVAETPICPAMLVIASEVGGCTMKVSGTVKSAGANGMSEPCGWVASSWIKLIGSSSSGLTKNGGVLDPLGPSPLAQLASTSCWAACNSSMRAAVFPTEFTLTDEPILLTTIVSPGSSTMMCRGIGSLVISSNEPCSRSLYVMLSSSRNVTSGAAASASFINKSISAVSDSMPIPPEWVRLRMLPTGVSTQSEPASATRPATKAKMPLATANRADRKVPLESRANSLSTTRVSWERLNTVPSMKRISIHPPAAVSMISPRKTGSPTMNSTPMPLARLIVTQPIAA